jgi:hypothetical protein
VPAPAAAPPELAVTRSDLDHLGLRKVRPFRIAALADKRRGRPRSPGPRVYLHRLPTYFNARTSLAEIALALLLLDGRVAAAFITARPDLDKDQLRDRIHDEGLYPKASYFGLKKLIGLRPKRGPITTTRHDAYRRARTEPKPRRVR